MSTLSAWLARRATPRFYQRGFTLIEVVVTATILVAVVGGGISGLIAFNEKQTLVGAARQLQAFMRAAQTRAGAQDVPAGCETGGNKLWAYRVSVQKDVPGALVSMNALCAADKRAAATSVPLSPVRDSFQLPPGVTVSTPNPGSGSCQSTVTNMDFYVLHGGVDLNGAITCSVTSMVVTVTGAAGRTYTFTVTQGGTITEGQLN